MAVRLAGSQRSNATLSNVDARAQRFNLSSDFAVPGASGTLVFSSTRDGNVGDEPVPIIVAPGSAPAARPAAPYLTPRF